MKINVSKNLENQFNKMIEDSNFSYDSDNDELNGSDAHMVGQKSLMRIDILQSFLNEISGNDILEENILKLSNKMLSQLNNDIDYMYPNDEYEEDHAHLVMQLLKRTGEDFTIFTECLNKSDFESNINLINFLTYQFKEFNKDIDYAYPNGSFDDDNAHIVVQGLLGKSDFIYDLIDNLIIEDENEKLFQDDYLGKIGDIIKLLSSCYDNNGFYQNNGHEVFSNLLSGLSVELENIKNFNIVDNKLTNNTQEDSKIDDVKKESEKEDKKIVIEQKDEIPREDSQKKLKKLF